ncbi:MULTISPECIES: hypothetical protein [Pseudomonas]|uniref:hypothetical protein n=1 Tax=Pseudomonas TaxID=286 RepID=UPI00249A8AC1|nr:MULTISPECIES: hypothetical protein [Pseudomonas]
MIAVMVFGSNEPGSRVGVNSEFALMVPSTAQSNLAAGASLLGMLKGETVPT